MAEVAFTDGKMMPETTQNSLCSNYTEAELETMFQNRYTETDEGFMKTVSTPLPPPPCVPNWYSKPKRIFDWANRGGRGDRGRSRGGYNRSHHRDGPSRIHYPGMKRDDRQHRYHPYGQERTENRQHQWNRDQQDHHKSQSHPHQIRGQNR